MTRGQANLLRAFSIWTVYVWMTRMWNIWRDDQSVGFKLVHTVLAVVSIAFAVACWIVVRRVRRRRTAGERETAASEVDRTPVA
jgi:ABC-type nickel/cobalt efflux system permease component RcnA